jgi:beta-lactamase regulating signal transducer with metallopeptidase domain
VSLPVTGLVLETVLNGFFQSLLLGAASCLLVKVFPRISASSRYVIWYVTLVAALLLPLAYLAMRWPVAKPAPTEPATLTEIAGADAVAASREETRVLPITLPLSRATPLLLAAWILGASLLLVRISRGYRQLRRLKAGSEAAPETLQRWSEVWRTETPQGRSADLRVSRAIPLPITAGLMAPVVIFPTSLVARLTQQDAYSVWLHETAHVRRRDDWTKLLQRLIEAPLFFHPVVRWLGRKLDLERELACDEWVVRRTGEPRTYATCLTRLAEFVAQGPSALPALSMAADRKQIFRRVEMILDSNRETPARASFLGGAFALALVILGAVSLSLTSPTLVMAQHAPVAPVVEASPSPMVAEAIPPAPPQRLVPPQPRQAEVPAPAEPPAAPSVVQPPAPPVSPQPPDP